jgi:mannosyl-oligosaccharide alpha-1,2-mannosidase
MYQDSAWEAFVAINKTCRTESGYSNIADVNKPDGGEKRNMQRRFLFAEMLKYSYIIFAEEEEWQYNVKGRNVWVFNTEAHPFKVQGKPV